MDNGHKQGPCVTTVYPPPAEHTDYEGFAPNEYQDTEAYCELFKRSYGADWFRHKEEEIRDRMARMTPEQRGLAVDNLADAVRLKALRRGGV